MSRLAPTSTARKPVLRTCTACPRLSRVNHSPRHCLPRVSLAPPPPPPPQNTISRKRKRPASAETEGRRVRITGGTEGQRDGSTGGDGNGGQEVTLKVVYETLLKVEKLVERLEGVGLAAEGRASWEGDDTRGDWEEPARKLDFGEDRRVRWEAVRRLVETDDGFENIAEEEENSGADKERGDDEKGEEEEKNDATWEEEEEEEEYVAMGMGSHQNGEDEDGGDRARANCRHDYGGGYSRLGVGKNGTHSSLCGIEFLDTGSIHNKGNSPSTPSAPAAPQSSTEPGFIPSHISQAFPVAYSAKRKRAVTIAGSTPSRSQIPARCSAATAKPFVRLGSPSRSLLFVPKGNHAPQLSPAKRPAPPQEIAATPLRRTDIVLRPPEARHFYGTPKIRKAETAAGSSIQKTQPIHRSLKREDGRVTDRIQAPVAITAAAVAKGVGNTADEKMAVPTETDGLSSPHNGETLTAGTTAVSQVQENLSVPTEKGGDQAASEADRATFTAPHHQAILTPSVIRDTRAFPSLFSLENTEPKDDGQRDASARSLPKLPHDGKASPRSSAILGTHTPASEMRENYQDNQNPNPSILAFPFKGEVTKMALFPPHTPSLVGLRGSCAPKSRQVDSKGEGVSRSAPGPGKAVCSLGDEEELAFEFPPSTTSDPIVSKGSARTVWHKVGSSEWGGASAFDAGVSGSMDTRLESDAFASPSDERGCAVAPGSVLDGGDSTVAVVENTATQPPTDEKDLALSSSSDGSGEVKEETLGSRGEMSGKKTFALLGFPLDDMAPTTVISKVPTQKGWYSVNVTRLGPEDEPDSSLVAGMGSGKGVVGVGLRNSSGYQAYLRIVDSAPDISPGGYLSQRYSTGPLGFDFDGYCTGAIAPGSPIPRDVSGSDTSPDVPEDARVVAEDESPSEESIVIDDEQVMYRDSGAITGYSFGGAQETAASDTAAPTTPENDGGALLPRARTSGLPTIGPSRDTLASPLENKGKGRPDDGKGRDENATSFAL